MNTDGGHRVGLLKQTNKPHKTGRHRSKGAINNASKGRVSIKISSFKSKQQERREQRRNHMNQLRKSKREEVLLQKRQLGGYDTVPFLVCILPLNSQISAESILMALEKCDKEAIVKKSCKNITYITIPRFKQRFSFIIPPIGCGNEPSVLDYLKVCDTTLLLTSAVTGEDNVMDEWGYKIFNMISAQGIPTPIVALTDLDSIAPKKRSSAKIAVLKVISKILPYEKVMTLGNNADGLNLFRRIGGQKKNTIYNKANRPHLFGEKVEFIEDDESSETGSLKIMGFLRGIPLDVNELVHIPGLGDFQMKRIDVCNDPYKFDKNDIIQAPYEIATYKADAWKQRVIQRENVPNIMDDEEKEIEIKEIEDVNEDANSISSNEDSEKEEYMSCESEVDSDNEIEEVHSTTEEQCDTTTDKGDSVDNENYDLTVDLQEERETFKKIKEARTDKLWPDEVDTPLDIPARERFQKYRGLESLRTSPWDPKENLPDDYARIFQFKNFDMTKRRIIKEAAANSDAVKEGRYVAIYVSNVPIAKWRHYQSVYKREDVVVYGLLPHEHQMSVVNVVLKRTPNSEVPIKSKERLIFQCGYRRFVVNPIFSQHTTGGKHKYERFFHPGTTVVATFYAPIQFPPAPVLCFKENPNKTLCLVACGNLLSCNPNRIILKRIVLSGHPLKVNRKTAVIRYMFFNKEDVEYFKPIKLRTKCGHLGHIKESLGTHGHMKCIFDKQLRSYDTVFLYLYKRVFPKWNYEEYNTSCGDEMQ